jgi:predicted ArsR family transcriptional regulator
VEICGKNSETESTVEQICCKTVKWPNSLVAPECFPELCDMEEEAITGSLGQTNKAQILSKREDTWDGQAGGVYVEKVPFSCDIPLE